ncbi:hypothetical protein [Actinoallomurus iriomotensis]|uniref:Uncharacterized protein n=1 Tax=Actinoallomurus iriomotensis TaxID=478107 RepID=A0A9W6W6B2_9ACTN|nr:hypothetical protein [Actinoallomurus iriomotensis]GLY92289.1 hypothetical protein Airi02_102170 [Actinoallomurus iriomotensis]
MLVVGRTQFPTLVGAKVNVIGRPGRATTVAPASATVNAVRVSVEAGPVGGEGFIVWGTIVPRGTATLVVVAGVVEVALPAQPAADIETTATTEIRHGLTPLNHKSNDHADTESRQYVRADIGCRDETRMIRLGLSASEDSPHPATGHRS